MQEKVVALATKQEVTAADVNAKFKLGCKSRGAKQVDECTELWKTELSQI